VERWSVKTGIDSDASHIDISSPQTANIVELIALQRPSPLPKDTRFPPAENTVFVVNATLTDYKLETGSTDDSDYHLVLMDEQGNTMVAEIPSLSCVAAGSRFVTQITNARAQFDDQFSVTSSFQTANIPVRVTGIGFFDFFHHHHGVAPNVIELHPVLDIQFNPSPANGDFAFSASSAAMHVHGGSSSSVNLTASPIGSLAGQYCLCRLRLAHRNYIADRNPGSGRSSESAERTGLGTGQRGASFGFSCLGSLLQEIEKRLNPFRDREVFYGV
jgi:hypothetical protein